MSITIKLFSSLREVLGESEFEFALNELDSATTVAGEKSALSQRGTSWQEALNQPNLVHALNHKVVYIDAEVAAGDELAFFPPMTGG